MLGGATQAMPLVHRRGAPTTQTAPRRHAPSGCGPQARWLRCSLLTYHTGYARRSRLASEPGGQQQSANVILWRALSTPIRNYAHVCWWGSEMSDDQDGRKREQG